MTSAGSPGAHDPHAHACLPGETGFPDPRPYRQIADRFRQQITQGTLRPGDPLPSIASIRRESGHSRHTVSKAMHLLVSENLIFQTPGHPYCVVGRPPR